MEIVPAVPEWLTLSATCGAAVLALAVLTRGLEALLDLDIG